MLTACGCISLIVTPPCRWAAFAVPQPPLTVVGGRAEPAAMQKRSRFGFTPRHTQTEFERLVRPHLDHLFKLAYRFTGTADRAEDLIQDLLLRLYPRCAELAAVEQPRPWLVRVMYRLFIDQTRRNARAPYISLADSNLAAAEADGDPYADIAGAGPTPEAELEMSFDRERLARAWDALSPDHRVLLALFEIEGYTLEELESMLDVTRGTLKSRLHRARARLAALLGTEPLDAFERVEAGRSMK